MHELKVTYRIVTPMQLHGANRQRAELRLPSIKGILRFWYRAINPDFHRPWTDKQSATQEEALFGSGRTRIGRGAFGMQWTANQYRTMSHRSAAFPAGMCFSFLIRPHGERMNPIHWQGLLASLWLLGQIGGLGSSNRRGNGSLALAAWDVNEDAARKGLESLPLLDETLTQEEWIAAFQRGFAILRRWFAMPKRAQHPHLGADAAFYLGKRCFATGEEAQAEGKAALNQFRQNYEESAPALGFPLPRNQKTSPHNQAKLYQGRQKLNRLASPISLRVVQIGERFAPLFVLLSAPYPLSLRCGDKQIDWPSFYTEARTKLTKWLQPHYQRIELKGVSV